MKLNFHMDGTTYHFDGDHLSNIEMRLMKLHLGLGPTEIGEWERQLLTVDNLDAIILVMLFARRRAGEKVEWADYDDLDAEETMRAWSDAIQRAAADYDAEHKQAKPAAKRQPAK